MAAIITQLFHLLMLTPFQVKLTAKLKRFIARPTFEDEMELHRVDCLGSNGLTDNYDFMKEKAEEFSKAPLIPERLLSGADLIALGWQPGKAMGAALTALQNAQLEGLVATREEALAWLQSQPLAGKPE